MVVVDVFEMILGLYLALMSIFVLARVTLRHSPLRTTKYFLSGTVGMWEVLGPFTPDPFFTSHQEAVIYVFIITLFVWCDTYSEKRERIARRLRMLKGEDHELPG